MIASEKKGFYFFLLCYVSKLSIYLKLTKEIITNCFMILKNNFITINRLKRLSYNCLINEIIIAYDLHVILIFFFGERRSNCATQLIKLTRVDMKSLEVQYFHLESSKNLFNNKEIRKLYGIVFNLSMTKRFYKKYSNYPAVGVYAKNIAEIQLRNQRYLEVINEQEELVLLANQDLLSLKEMEKICKSGAQPQDNQQLFKLYHQLNNDLDFSLSQKEPVFEFYNLLSQKVQPEHLYHVSIKIFYLPVKFLKSLPSIWYYQIFQKNVNLMEALQNLEQIISIHQNLFKIKVNLKYLQFKSIHFEFSIFTCRGFFYFILFVFIFVRILNYNHLRYILQFI
ncbi:unnamed protein product [Paramecium sonneborni]|uniref:Transmembrane protein n=1 Tax=Paramecium sonneborni TaxID=65129 RepID=A0A8S1RQ72_9CILI|nr:unnamed protein product [Paramecium sonneborni]